MYTYIIVMIVIFFSWVLVDNEEARTLTQI